jgi:hypothetical protein
MKTDLLATRLALRSRIAVTMIAAVCAGVAAADLLRPTFDRAATYAAIAVGAAAAIPFLCAVFDTRFHKALSMLNAERRARARELGWMARLAGVGLPVGDHVLFVAGLVLAALAVVSGLADHAAAAALGLAAFLLVAMTQIALMVRGYPSDRFAAPPA